MDGFILVGDEYGFIDFNIVQEEWLWGILVIIVDEIFFFDVFWYGDWQVEDGFMQVVVRVKFEGFGFEVIVSEDDGVSFDFFVGISGFDGYGDNFVVGYCVVGDF